MSTPLDVFLRALRLHMPEPVGNGASPCDEWLAQVRTALPAEYWMAASGSFYLKPAADAVLAARRDAWLAAVPAAARARVFADLARRVVAVELGLAEVADAGALAQLDAEAVALGMGPFARQQIHAHARDLGAEWACLVLLPLGKNALPWCADSWCDTAASACRVVAHRGRTPLGAEHLPLTAVLRAVLKGRPSGDAEVETGFAQLREAVRAWVPSSSEARREREKCIALLDAA